MLSKIQSILDADYISFEEEQKQLEEDYKKFKELEKRFKYASVG